MKNLPYLTFKSVFWIGLFSILLSSCISQKKMLYMQVKNKSDSLKSFVNKRNIDYHVKAGDNLYIRVVSLDEKTNILLNPQGGQSGNSGSSDASVYLNSYTVSEDGTVSFPLVGKLMVRNKTVDEIRKNLEVKLHEYLKEVIIIVKLVNFNITLLGEVKRPGQYKIYQNNINLFEAVSLAGDLTDFGKAKRVLQFIMWI